MVKPPHNDNRPTGAERRSSARRPIQLKASLSFRSAQNLPCEITDFCPEGIYIVYSAITTEQLQRLQLACNHTVQLSFHDSFVKRDHILQVTVTRLVEGAFGGMFKEGNSAAITALLRMCSAGNIRSSASVTQPGAASLFMRQAERTFKSHIEPMLESFLQSLPAKFEEAIEHAISNNQKASLTEAVVELRKQSSRFIPKYFHHIGEALVPRTGNGDSEDGGLSSANLSLIDKADFEDWLTLKVIVTKADTAYNADLLKIKIRLDALGIHSVKGYANPLGPAVVCYALRDTLIQIHLPPVAERLCLKQFETSVVHELGALYKELEELTERQSGVSDTGIAKIIKSKDRSKPEKKGKKDKETVSPAPVVKKEKVTQKKTPEKPPQDKKQELPGDQVKDDSTKPVTPEQPVPGTAQPADAQTGGSPLSNLRPLGAASPIGGFLATAEESVAAVNTLLASLRERRLTSEVAAKTSSVFPSADEAAPYQDEEFIGNLHQLQAAPIADNAEVDDISLREKMAHSVEGEEIEAKSFTPEQDNTLDVVDRFFASMLQNNKLSEISKNQIKGMEVPVLGLLLNDPDFFEDLDHPARKLIDRLAQIGIKGGRTSPSHLSRVNSIVEKVQEEFDQKPEVFEEALAEIDGMVDRQNLLHRRNLERVTAAAEGHQKIDESKRVVASAVRARVENRKIPKAVATLLKGGWQDLLSLTYIRQGPESQAWQDYLDVIDNLIQVGQDPDFKCNIPELIKVIQEGLSAMSSNHIPPGHVRDEIKNLLVRRPGTSSPELMEMAVTAEDDAEEDEDLLEKASQRGLKRWLHRAQKLKIGDWMKLERTENQPELIRLAWTGKNFSRYVFVNHQGMKVIDLDALTLAAYLKEGIAVYEPDIDRPVIDESLDTMVKDLYEQISHAGTHDELTGLMLRKEFERQVQVQLSLLTSDDQLSCLLVSLEGFRLINDSAGTEAGDSVLKQLAFQLKEKLPDEALLCRFSGDEFMLTIAEAAASTLDVVRNVINEFEFEWEEKLYGLSAGIGYVEIKPNQMDVGHLLQAAEDTCRAAKKKGLGNTEECKLDKKQIEQREAIASKLVNIGKGVDEERLLLRSQKIIPLHQNAKVGIHHEILLSIYDDEGHLLPSSDFIQAAEGSKRIQEVDRWVVGKMLDWAVENREKISQIAGISINISCHSLNDDSFLEFIFDRITTYDCPLDKVTFELVDAAAIAKLHEVGDFIRELQEYGCRFCLGHYGSGRVTYKYLKALPVDMIKVDGSYIRDLDTDENDELMIKSMVDMAHYLKREVVAPQVETSDALEKLKKLGVDYAQGYFIERPKSLANLWAEL